MPQTSEIQGSVSGLELNWFRVKRKQDFVMRAQFRSILGNPSKNTFANYLRRPGGVKVSAMIRMAQWLSEVFGESIKPEDLVHFH